MLRLICIPEAYWKIMHDIEMMEQFLCHSIPILWDRHYNRHALSQGIALDEVKKKKYD